KAFHLGPALPGAGFARAGVVVVAGRVVDVVGRGRGRLQEQGGSRQKRERELPHGTYFFQRLERVVWSAPLILGKMETSWAATVSSLLCWSWYWEARSTSEERRWMTFVLV